MGRWLGGDRYVPSSHTFSLVRASGQETTALQRDAGLHIPLGFVSHLRFSLLFLQQNAKGFVKLTEPGSGTSHLVPSSKGSSGLREGKAKVLKCVLGRRKVFRRELSGVRVEAGEGKRRTHPPGLRDRCLWVHLGSVSLPHRHLQSDPS